VYVFDDQLDDTSLGKAKEQAAEYVDRMLSVLDDDGWSVSMSGKQPLAQILKGMGSCENSMYKCSGFITINL
jgi:hypothetical protein